MLVFCRLTWNESISTGAPGSRCSAPCANAASFFRTVTPPVDPQNYRPQDHQFRLPAKLPEKNSVEGGVTYHQASQQLGVSDWALRCWVKAFRESGHLPAKGQRVPLAEELKALASGEVDAVFGDKVQLWLWSQKPEGKCCEVVGQDVKDTQTLGIGVSAGLRREDIKLRDAFNKALGEMISDGTYKKINDKYFPFPLN